MSKVNSGLFKGTSGERRHAIIAKSVKKKTEYDLRPHPRGASLSSNKRKEIAKRIKNRSATKSEYKLFESDKRFAKRRKEGILQFWKEERKRIIEKRRTTRAWSKSQKADILKGLRPKYKGKSIQGHHTYSASMYPHIANIGKFIYPVTFDEHLYGWHGGNFRKSAPGKPLRFRKKYNFRRLK